MNGNFEVGTVIKGKDLKGEILCKILSEDMVMKGFQYKIGMNECKTGLYFCLARDICNYLYNGIKLAVVSVPDAEDVYIRHKALSAYKLVVERVLQLDEVLSKVTGWECLILNGTDITADNNCAVRWAAKNGYLEVVEFLHKNGADITAKDNSAVRHAAENGYLEVVEYLHENGADITAMDNYAVRFAASNGHLEVLQYLYEHGADIRAWNNDAVIFAAEKGHLEVVKYLHEKGADIAANDNYAISQAAKYGHMDVVKYLKENM